jgi:hypothetical protein
MKKLLFVSFLLLTTSSFSQTKSFEFNLGINQSWFNYDLEILNDTKVNFRPKLSVSISYNYSNFGNFSTTAGIRYYHLGRSVTYDLENSNNATAKINHYLLSLPLQLKYKVGVINTDIFLNAEPSYILLSNINAPGFENEREITDEMNRIQFLIGLGIEYSFNINKEMFGIKSLFNYGITKIPKEGIFRSENGEYSWVAYKAYEVNLLLAYYF